MNKLIEFILARIADEESEIKRSAKLAAKTATQTNGSSALATMEADPFARPRIECKSRRQMVGVLQRMVVMHDLPTERSRREGAMQVLKLMALPYADHPAYQAEWKP